MRWLFDLGDRSVKNLSGLNLLSRSAKTVDLRPLHFKIFSVAIT